jgi:capsular exopolysaccharide synthesis family protein
VTVRSVSPAEAQITANAVVEAFVQSELLASSGLPGSVSILDAAVLPSNPISPFPPLSVSEVAARTAVLEEVLKSLVSRRVLLDKALSDGAIDLGTDDDVAYLQRRLEITTASPLIELSIAAGSRELALRIVSSVAATFVTSDLLRVLYSESTLVTASHAATVSEIEPSGMLSSIASGAAVLLLVAIIVALVREYFDDRVRTPEEMLAAAPVPALGLIARTSSSRSEIESLRDPPTAAGEAYRAVRTRLAQEIERRGKVLAVSGPGHGDGRTTVVANLAAVFGVAGRRVVVVDADLRTPALHDHLAVGNAIGLTTLLRTAGMDIDGAVRETDTENVSALTAGLPVPNPSELLTSARMQSLLDELRSRYDVVMVDTAPAPEYGDASVIASKADAILLVARANRTRAGELTAAFQELSTYERPIVGAILTDVRRSRLRPRRRGVEEFAEADSNAYGTGIGSASSEVAATTSD